MQGRGRGEPRHCPPPAHSLELTAHPAQPIAAWVPPPALRTELATTLPLLHSYIATCLWSPGSQGVAVRRRVRLAGTMKVYRPPASGGAAAWCPDTGTGHKWTNKHRDW